MFSFPVMTLFKCLSSKVKSTPLLCSNEIFILFERTLTFSTIIKFNRCLSPSWSLAPSSHSQLGHPLHSLMNHNHFDLELTTLLPVIIWTTACTWEVYRIKIVMLWLSWISENVMWASINSVIFREAMECNGLYYCNRYKEHC